MFGIHRASDREGSRISILLVLTQLIALSGLIILIGLGSPPRNDDVPDPTFVEEISGYAESLRRCLARLRRRDH
ncbi:hypothetical protein PlfCFBP13513_15590 [Plantibacter flavus]|uniref:hypothetical protein n=1 Tax=Plantibacter TaxID=190323 RepID=UPI0010C21476|nr:MULTISPECIES: hypothetical protein [Plantibacter]MBD8103920.1 hypothetical protein [Plantibacter sp. CFBP 8775]MBD8467368.1 hypothetical protein [Plantibacter sp. CFBP 8798]MBD8518572.1 hypothetical protein [Plantibacter sp. CFBP 8804]MBD8534566.1 hypothetical protein [Plantibacter sp. CFBP 13570]TKJ96834.1 hypothetical protein PlfCFBP13513_15590 [Plantibacter flavus]